MIHKSKFLSTPPTTDFLKFYIIENAYATTIFSAKILSFTPCR